MKTTTPRVAITKRWSGFHFTLISRQIWYLFQIQFNLLGIYGKFYLFQEFLNLAKKKNKKKRSPVHSEDGDSSDSDSDSGKHRSKKNKSQRSHSMSSDSDKGSPRHVPEKSQDHNSEPEEGEVSDSSDSSEAEFNDGYDDQLMGDEEDRARLASLTEKERETEIYKRIEQRELMKHR